MAQIESEKVGAQLRFLAANMLPAEGAAILTAYADEIDPQPVTLTLTAREFEILRALVDGAPHANSMTNRASHARWDWRLSADIAESERIGLVELFEKFD